MRLLIAAAAIFASNAFAHDDDAASAKQKLGKVNFPSSCNPQVQQKVTRGVAMLHSFWWPQGEATFQEIANDVEHDLLVRMELRIGTGKQRFRIGDT